MESVRPHDWPVTGHVSHVVPARPASSGEPHDPWVIGEHEIHVWFDPPGRAQVDDVWLLDPAERDRARRFRMDVDRASFISHHAFTRRVLAPYLGLAPEAITMRTAASGKPEVAASFGLTFNTSRSGGCSVVAVAGQDVRVGVDIERVRPIDDALLVADAFFTERERRALRDVPRSRRDEAFLALWTRKEAVVKASGAGLSAALDTFAVADGDDVEGAWRGRLGTRPFMVTPLVSPAGWVAAACVTATQLVVRQRDRSVLTS